MTGSKAPELNSLYEEIRKTLLVRKIDAKHDGDFTHPVFGDGDPDASLMLLGEAPGADEAAAGKPFVGKAGKQLDELLADAGIVRAQIYITNTVKYRPVTRSLRSVRNRTPSTGEIAEALPYLAREIAILRPRVIATLGNTPLSAMLALASAPRDTVGSCHGSMQELRFDGFSCALFPLYHPASGIYNRALIEVMHQDARKLGENLVKQA